MSVEQATKPNKKQTIEELTKRYEGLNKKKIQAETNLDHAQKALKKLQEEAIQKFGTDDLSQLKQKLADMETANEKARGDYQASLDAIESALTKVEENLTSDESAQRP
jgi:hypothetical protein